MSLNDNKSRLNLYWAIIIGLLVIFIAFGSLAIWVRYPRSQPIEILTSPIPEFEGESYIGGAVNNPGYYPYRAEDSIAELIQAAGGPAANAALSQIRLYLPYKNEDRAAQKININQAEAWLLQALPGIGEVRAQAIIDYRQQNGPFRSINEVVKVEGISSATYERIKDLITVAD